MRLSHLSKKVRNDNFMYILPKLMELPKQWNKKTKNKCEMGRN